MTRSIAGLVTMLVVLAPSARAADQPDLPKAHVIVDRGTMTASTPEGVLLVDLKTGALELNLAKGAVWQTTTPLGLPPAKDPLARFDYLALDSLAAGPYGESSLVCESEASTVSALASLLTTVCANPSTLLCSTTTAAFGYAVDALRDCLSRVVQQEK